MSIELQRKLPASFVGRSAVIAVIAIGFVIDAFFFNPEFRLTLDSVLPFLTVGAIVSFASYLDYLIIRGYCVWYDDHAIYQRKAGIWRRRAQISTVEFGDVGRIVSIDQDAHRKGYKVFSRKRPSQFVILAKDYIEKGDIDDLISLIETRSTLA